MKIDNFVFHIAPAYSIAHDINDDCHYIIISSSDRYPYVEDDGVSLTIAFNVIAVHDSDRLVKTAKKKATLTETAT